MTIRRLVIATGGNAVFRKPAQWHLQQHGLDVHRHADPDTPGARIGDIRGRFLR